MDYFSNFLQLLVWVLSVYTGIVFGSSTTPLTTKKPQDAKQTQPADDKKGMPAWMIGVIILSIIAVIVLVATVVQKLVRRRLNRRDEYQIRSQ